MKYDVAFSNGRVFKNMSEAEFYMFFHTYHGLDYAVYDNNKVLQGPFDSNNNFVGELCNKRTLI
jgi:hypothetical protein